MKKAIEKFTEYLKEKIKNKKVHIVSHFDTDGITSAAIFIKTLERLSYQFSVKILKQLSKEEIQKFPKDRPIILLDLGSGSLAKLGEISSEIFIIDHHEITERTIPKNIEIINPHLLKHYENLCSAELTYLVSKQISEENQDLAHLAVIGMIGDTMEKEISKTRDKIIKEANIKVRKGLLIYPSTRPLDKTLEYSAKPFIPGVTGDAQGTLELLNEAGIDKVHRTYKALIDLNDAEMKQLATAVMLRLSSQEKTSEYLGNLYLVKFFNKIEDAREISAIINACSRMGQPEVAMMFCLNNSSARKTAERIYFRYRRQIISGLKYVEECAKIKGKYYVIIDMKDKVKDTIVGTISSILSFSSVYPDNTIIIGMAYDEDKIKVSCRIAGRQKKSSQNLKELMTLATQCLGGESGGHKRAAGCTIKKEHKERFIELIKNKLEFELVKVETPKPLKTKKDLS
jgi:RecJ-like exonuclease